MASFEDVGQWIPQQIWENWGPEPTEIYCKGDYRNVAYAIFKNKEDRDKCIQLLQKKFKLGGVKIKEDLPPIARAPKSVLLGLRWMLME